MPDLRYVPVPDDLDAEGPERPPARVWTTGHIADHLDVPIHRVQYAITSRKIREAARAGRLRLFDREGVQRIAEALKLTGGDLAAAEGVVR